MVDFMTGATGATGLLACILRAQQTGIGCDVDTCLFDVAMHQLSYSAIWYLNAGEALAPPAAQRASRGRAGPDLPDRGRLDLHHVHDRQVLDELCSMRSAGQTWSADAALRHARRGAGRIAMR